MTEIDRRTALSTAATLAAGAMTSTLLAQDVRAKLLVERFRRRLTTVTGVKALVYDVFGTVVDWRNGVARDAERILKPLGYSLNWIESPTRGVRSTSRPWKRCALATGLRQARRTSPGDARESPPALRIGKA
jgi:hypothetical protein